MGTELPVAVCPLCGEPLDLTEQTAAGLVRCYDGCNQLVQPEYEEDT